MIRMILAIKRNYFAEQRSQFDLSNEDAVRFLWNWKFEFQMLFRWTLCFTSVGFHTARITRTSGPRLGTIWQNVVLSFPPIHNKLYLSSTKTFRFYMLSCYNFASLPLSFSVYVFCLKGLKAYLHALSMIMSKWAINQTSLRKGG